MFCGVPEAARNCNRLGHRRVPPEVEFSGALHLSAYQKVWFLKVLQLHRNRLGAHDLGVGRLYELLQLGQGFTRSGNFSETLQRGIAVWLDGHVRLIEFRRERKTDVE